jgi:hypothetical protein
MHVVFSYLTRVLTRSFDSLKSGGLHDRWVSSQVREGTPCWMGIDAFVVFREFAKVSECIGF